MRNEINLTGKILRKDASTTQDITEVLDVLGLRPARTLPPRLRRRGDVAHRGRRHRDLDAERVRRQSALEVARLLHPGVTASNRAVKVTVSSGILRYIRWKLTLGGTGSPAVTFTITGVGRF